MYFHSTATVWIVQDSSEVCATSLQCAYSTDFRFRSVQWLSRELLTTHRCTSLRQSMSTKTWATMFTTIRILTFSRWQASADMTDLSITIKSRFCFHPPGVCTMQCLLQQARVNRELTIPNSSTQPIIKSTTTLSIIKSWLIRQSVQATRLSMFFIRF